VQEGRCDASLTVGHVRINPIFPVPQIAANVQHKVKKIMNSLNLTKQALRHEGV
jgi:hypothetical protein